jgi:hypothetical protein
MSALDDRLPEFLPPVLDTAELAAHLAERHGIDETALGHVGGDWHWWHVQTHGHGHDHIHEHPRARECRGACCTVTDQRMVPPPLEEDPEWYPAI